VIPQRVKLSGFLCYQDEQNIPFDSSPLWMLSGLNGSGKSSIFDAITYALFGHHRGGATQAVELINKESKALSVEFEFKLDQQNVMIRRTLKRQNRGGGTGTQQIYMKTEGDTQWVAVEGTQYKVQFDEWIREKIGLNYETFTSSVLLLQGKAEKLLDSKPSGRAEVLAGIVDLERYQKLHEKADTQRKEFKSKLEVLNKQFEGVPDVNDLEIAAAQNRIEDAQEGVEKIHQRIDILQVIEFQARNWVDLQLKLGKARERLQRAESIIGEADRIEKQYQRLIELREVLPQVGVILGQRSAIAESERKVLRLQAEVTTLSDRITDKEREQLLGKKKRETLDKQLTLSETRQREVDSHLRDLTVVMDKLGEVSQHEAQLQRYVDELSRLPNDPQLLVTAKSELLDERMDLLTIVPTLERLVQERQSYVEARAESKHAEGQTKQVKRQGEEKKKQHEQLQQELVTVTDARSRADEAATTARTLFDQAKQQLRELQQVTGAKVCRACGQPLTPGHIEEEKTRREQELGECERNAKTTRSAQLIAQKAEQQARENITTLDEELRLLREQYSTSKNQIDLQKKAIDQHTQRCRELYGELPKGYREAVSLDMPMDWAMTDYPAPLQLKKLRAEANDCAAIRRQLEEAQKALSRWTTLQTQIRTSEETLTRLRKTLPPEEPVQLRQQFASLQAEDATLRGNVTASRRSITDQQTNQEAITRELNKLMQQRTELQGQIATEANSRKHSEERIVDAQKRLPATWQKALERAGLTERSQWQDELDDLTSRAIEKRYRELELARQELATLRAEIAERESEATAFPEETRRDIALIREELQQTKQSGKQADDALRNLLKERDILLGYRARRDEIRSEYREIETELNWFKLLSELLGKDRLQRSLVRQAERQIVDYANGVLDRLSGGQLFLRLCGGEEGEGNDRALDLEACNRITGGAPINVAFLSGSQRFRVAVSLALGIGQYASRQHRPIESVIIDEGFGCLDRQGRQGMIQELQNLRGHLHCILLVSHQEEFAEAFPDGYKFELQNGATKVTRFAR